MFKCINDTFLYFIALLQRYFIGFVEKNNKQQSTNFTASCRAFLFRKVAVYVLEKK